jgi:D-alanine-D-alanine ligase
MQKPISSIHIAVFMGGPSSEKEISLSSGKAITKALRKNGYRVTAIEFYDHSLPALEEEIDFVFPALHGEFGEDGTLQKLLENRKIPYVGCNSATSKLIMDKQRCKERLQENGISVIPGILLTYPDQAFPKGLELPLIVKPNNAGSTIGLSLVRNEKEWQSAIKHAYQHDREVVVENYVEGTEVTVGILNNQVLPLIQIVPPGLLFDFDAKYSKGKTLYLCPPKDVSMSLYHRIQAIAGEVNRILKGQDLLRVDLIIHRTSNEPLILEANSMPGFTENSLLPKAAAAHGIGFIELCRILVETSWDRQKT